MPQTRTISYGGGGGTISVPTPEEEAEARRKKSEAMGRAPDDRRGTLDNPAVVIPYADTPGGVDSKTGGTVPYRSRAPAPASPWRGKSPQPVPAWSAPRPSYSDGGLFDKPGWGEQWYANNGSKWDQPSQAGQYWNSVSGAFQGGKVAPQNTIDAYGRLQGALGQPGQGTAAAYSGAQQLTGGQWQGDQYISGTAMPFFQQQGQGETYASWAAPQTQQAGYGETTAQRVSGNLANAGAGENYARGQLPFFNQQGQGETYASWAAPQTRQQGQGEATANSISNAMRTAGSGERFAQGQLGYFQGQGQMEQLYPSLARDIQGIRYGDQAIGAAGSAVNASNATNNLLPRMLDEAGQNPVGDEYGFFSSGLRNPSFSEDLYTSGTGEKNLTTYYDRQQQKQAKAINDQMAARGLFGSGAAIRAQEELAADIGASQARDMAGLASQADQARLGRTGEARSFATAMDDSERARLGMGLDAAMASDSNTRENAGLLLGAYGMASGEALERAGQLRDAASAAQGMGINRVNSGINSALNTDRLGIDRNRNAADISARGQELGMDRLRTGSNIAFQGQTAATDRVRSGIASALDTDRLGIDRNKASADVALAGQNAMMNRLDTGSGIAFRGQEAATNRTRAGVEAAGEMDRNRASRLFQGGQLGLSADAEERGRATDLFKGAQGLDDQIAQSERDYFTRLEGGARIAGMADTSNRAQLEGGMNAAERAQMLFEGRNLSAFGIDMGLGSKLAGIVESGNTEAVDEWGASALKMIQILMEEGGLTAEQYQDKADGIMKLIGEVKNLAQQYGGKGENKGGKGENKGGK